MSTANDAYLGRDIAVYYSLSTSTTPPVDHVRLGMVRGKEFGPEWDTVDATADTSPGQIRQYLATFKNFNPSFDGVSSLDDADNQDALESHINAPPVASNSQPCGWIKIVRPRAGTSVTRVYDVPVLFTSFRITGAYDDVSTWSMDTQSTGSVTITDA